MATTWADLGIEIHDSANGQIYTTCPRCSHTRKKQSVKCLSINLTEGLWNCHHPECSWSGSLAQGEDRRHVTTIRRYHMPVPLPIASPQANMLSWFHDRGIPVSVLERRKIVAAKVYMPQDDDEITGIAFPYFRHGVHVNTKYRDAHKHFCMASKCELLLYGMDDIQGDTLCIVEGELDALALEVAGISSVVSVPNGAPSPQAKNFASHFDYLTSAEDILKPLRKILIAVDNDAPGQKLSEELARRLGQERCWRVMWPTDCATVHHGWSETSTPCKDANDVLMHHGVEVLRQRIEHAQPWPVSGIVTVDMLLPAIDALYTHGTQPGVSPGWVTLADYYNVREGEMTVIVGSPAHGKSRFLSNMIVNIATNHDWRFAVFSPESAPMERYARLLIEQYTQKSFHGQHQLEEPELWEAQDWLNDHFSFLMPKDAAPTVKYLLDLTRIQVQRKGVKGLVLDPWNWIEHGRGARQSETEYVSEMLTQVCLFAVNHGVHVWLIVHPTKMRKDQKGQYEGKYPPATLYDCSGSANFANKTHNGLSVWRDIESGSRRTQIHILKVRFEEIGTTGTVELVYDPMTKCYREPLLTDF